MTENIYLLSFALLVASSAIGHKLDTGYRSDAPLNPRLMQVVTGGAGILAFLLFGSGFFMFAWWMPIVGLLIAVICGPIGALTLSRVLPLPLVAIMFGIVGAILAISLVFL